MVVFQETFISNCHRVETPRLSEIINDKQQESWSVWKGKDARQITRQNCEVHVSLTYLIDLHLGQALFLCVNSPEKDELCKAVRIIYLG